MPSDLRVLRIAAPVAASTGFDIRAIERADEDTLAAVYLASYPPEIGAADPDTAKDEIAATFAGDYGIPRKDASLVLSDGGTIVGAVLVTERSIWDEELDGPFVIDLFVSPTQRGKGFGRALMLQAIAACAAHGDATLSLRVGDGTTEAAHRLYSELGFVDPSASFSIEAGRDPDATRRILEALPEWFGDPDAIDNYVVDAGDPSLLGVLARSASSVVGVALVRRHFAESAELHLIAIDPAWRGKGVGHALVERVASDAKNQGCSLLSVHTVGPSFEDDGYRQTREFYRALGFVPLEEHLGLDWGGPSVIMVRVL